MNADGGVIPEMAWEEPGFTQRVAAVSLLSLRSVGEEDEQALEPALPFIPAVAASATTTRVPSRAFHLVLLKIGNEDLHGVIHFACSPRLTREPTP